MARFHTIIALAALALLSQSHGAPAPQQLEEVEFDPQEVQNLLEEFQSVGERKRRALEEQPEEENVEELDDSAVQGFLDEFKALGVDRERRSLDEQQEAEAEAEAEANLQEEDSVDSVDSVLPIRALLDEFHTARQRRDAPEAVEEYAALPEDQQEYLVPQAEPFIDVQGLDSFFDEQNK